MTQSSLPSEPVLDSATAALPTAATTSPPPRPRWPLAAVVTVAVTLTLAVTATGWGLYLSHRNAQNTVPGVYLDGEPLGALSFANLPIRLSEEFLVH